MSMLGIGSQPFESESLREAGACCPVGRWAVSSLSSCRFIVAVNRLIVRRMFDRDVRRSLTAGRYPSRELGEECRFAGRAPAGQCNYFSIADHASLT